MYHIFTQKYNSKYIASGDVCIYCNQMAEDIYSLLSDEVKLLYKDTDTINDHIKYLSKGSPCPNGLSEEEWLIKKLLE